MPRRFLSSLILTLVTVLSANLSQAEFELPTNLFLNDLSWGKTSPSRRNKVGIRCTALRDFDKYSLLFHEDSGNLTPYVRLNRRGSCRLAFEEFEELLSENEVLSQELAFLIEQIPEQVELILSNLNPWRVRSTQVRILVRPEKDKELWGMSGLIQGLTLQWPRKWDLALHIEFRFFRDGEKPLTRIIPLSDL